jgi:alkanesulfonate monooxygenase SsuD/methylene tetrahydromethanopterin reductase-like flavin-dependent oxidoreductase (luciferase family)
VQFGLFSIPLQLDYFPSGGRTPKQIIDWDLQTARWADEYGVAEMWFAEHYTLGTEPSPAPDLMIAAASQLTKNLRLAAGAHLLPYHNPVSLAHRLMWLDHMTGGRYIAGFAQGAYPTDGHLFDLPDMPVRLEMMREAQEIILAIWTREEPFRIEGRHWTVDVPEYDELWRGPHLKPLQQPHPPVAITGASRKSGSLIGAGKRGFMPASQHVTSEILRAHWETYSTAATDAGHTPQRSEWRVLRDTFVADTDAEAREQFINGPGGRDWRDWMIPLFKELGLTSELAGDDVDPDDVTVEYLVDNMLLVGSVETVLERATAMQRETGGFGVALSFIHDYSENPEPYRRHLELLGREVTPRAAELGLLETVETSRT